MKEKLGIDEIDESFAHELAKFIRELGFNDDQVREMFNTTILHAHPIDYSFFSLILMNRMGTRKTPKPVTADHIHTMEVIKKIWWQADDKASQWLLEKALFLLYTTYR